MGIAHIISDIAVLGFVGICIYSGYQKGFFVPMMRLVGAVVSFLLTLIFAGRFVEPIQSYFFRDNMAHLVSTRVTAASAQNADGLKAQISEILSLEGIYDTVSRLLSDKTVDSIAGEGITTGGDILSAVVDKASASLAYGFVFVLMFAVINALFLLVVMIIGASFKLPVLSHANKITGMVLGGVFAVFAVSLLLAVALWCWPIFSFSFSVPAPNEFIDGTILLKFLARHNLVELLFRPFV